MDDLFASQPDPEDALLNAVYGMLRQEQGPTLASFLAERCEKRGVSSRMLAEALEVTPASAQRYLNGEVDGISWSTQAAMAGFLLVSPEDVYRLSAAGAPASESRRIEKARRFGLLTDLFDLKRLRDAGFIESKVDLEAAERRILDFFGVNSLSEYAQMADAEPAFSLPTRAAKAGQSRARLSEADRMRRFWVNLVHAQFQRYDNPYPYDRERLKQVVAKLRVATADVEKGFIAYRKALYECGVTVIVQAYIAGSGIKGATFVVQDKPCIVLTNYKDKYDLLWFTLAHELCHAVNDYDIIRGQGYHLSGENELFMDEALERTADAFARQLLLPDAAYRQAARVIDMPPVVRELAQAYGVHPSIIYGRFLFENKDKKKVWAKYNTLNHRPSGIAAIHHQPVEAWKRATLEDSLDEIRHSLEMTT